VQTERRSFIRRQADAALIRRVRELETTVDRRGESHHDEAGHARRHVIRHNCSVDISMPVRYSSGNSDTWNVDRVKVSGRMLDLSHGGAALFTKDPYDPGQELYLAIRLHERTGAIEAHAVVRWVKVVPKKGGYAVGVQFAQVSSGDQKKIADFLADLDATVGL
jgi:c-di-GMP-binding flagellar brake protein YcgR